MLQIAALIEDSVPESRQIAAPIEDSVPEIHQKLILFGRNTNKGSVLRPHFYTLSTVGKVLISSFFNIFSKKHKQEIDFKAAFLHFEHCRATPKGGQDLAPGEGEWPRLQK